MKLLFVLQYKAVTVPYPKDPDNIAAQIDAQQKESVGISFIIIVNADL